ncbi:hypothetical protein DFH28DRAFT_930833 [Melampsora americana]|nr:hypothetical protein DFH28DRAFT_930833 [Melampsora americana]
MCNSTSGRFWQEKKSWTVAEIHVYPIACAWIAQCGCPYRFETVQIARSKTILFEDFLWYSDHPMHHTPAHATMTGLTLPPGRALNLSAAFGRLQEDLGANRLGTDQHFYASVWGGVWIGMAGTCGCHRFPVTTGFIFEGDIGLGFYGAHVSNVEAHVSTMKLSL